jgi:hypothetical protein
MHAGLPKTSTGLSRVSTSPILPLTPMTWRLAILMAVRLDATFAAWLNFAAFDTLANGYCCTDCDIDIVVSERTGGVVGWYENSGNSQTFTQNAVAGGVTGLRAVMVMDVDDDGDLDIVSGAASPFLVDYYESDCCRVV